MQTKIILSIAFLMALATTCILGVKNSEKSGIISTQDKTISLLKSNVDSLNKALENKKENANVINLQFDKTKLKNGSTLIIDSKQLQALSCDTVNIVRWYEGLPRKEQRKFR